MDDFKALLEAYKDCLAENHTWHCDDSPILDYVATLEAKIARLEARQITPEMWALLDDAKAAGKEGNGGREFFALRDFINRLETLRRGER